MQYSITDERTEDTLDCTDDLQKAITLARGFAKETDNCIYVEDEDGYVLWEFMRRLDGTLLEEKCN